jgi:uncharacterized damage-inducible protein DinB
LPGEPLTLLSLLMRDVERKGASMINPMEGMAKQVIWMGQNTAHNLEFIPDDKLNWKPAPTANSALEIINHTAGALHGMLPVLSGGEYASPQFTPATNRKEAQELITSSVEQYAAALRRLTPQDLARTVQLPFGSFPLAMAASMPAVDVIHHHGQISYIQTILGDTESHFLPLE